MLPEDVIVVQEVSAFVHRLGKKMLCIPSFAGGVDLPQWKTYGFDVVTPQPNFAFYNVTTQRFAEVDRLISEFSAGVEMELHAGGSQPMGKAERHCFLR
jgi:hypothetical protein